MKSRSDNILLFDILECCERISSYIQGVSKSDFEQNYQLQDALIRKLEVIGEATKGLTTEITTGSPKIPWSKMAGMRDRMVHQYFRVDLDVVWQTVTADIPMLKGQIEPLYDALVAQERE
jgi:uncharacterized protein with HEPN domain